MNKDLFISKLREISWKRTDPDPDLDTIRLAFQESTGKLTYPRKLRNIYEYVAPKGIEITEEDKKALREFYEEIKGSSEFTVFWRYYNPDGEHTAEYSPMEKQEDYLVSDDLILFCAQRKDIPWIWYIAYTDDSWEKVKEIEDKYEALIRKLFDGREKQPSRRFTVGTVINCNNNYTINSFDVYSTAEIKDNPDFLDNYNPDLPVGKIKKFLGLDKGGIIIFNGFPGCGKTTYIKSLIFDNPEINFTIVPQYLLLNQEAFRNLLISESYENRVWIIEDCEQILIQREQNNVQFSSIISDILNYTDGIIGDLTRTKFIFTFNTDVTNIDNAILRRGRLKLRYEFLPLKGENLEKVASRIGYELTEEDRENGMSLADLYSHKEDTGEEIGQRKRIGFTTNYDIDSKSRKCVQGIPGRISGGY